MSPALRRLKELVGETPSMDHCSTIQRLYEILGLKERPKISMENRLRPYVIIGGRRGRRR